jgi:hypothetical protein
MDAVSRSDRSRQEAGTAAHGTRGELRKIAPLELTLAGRFRSETDEGSNEVSALISRMAGTSVAEIDKLIEELRALRDYLQAEGERVEREAARYTQVSQTALASVRIITDSMGAWKGNSGVQRN